jgi:hypothetical protein
MRHTNFFRKKGNKTKRTDLDVVAQHIKAQLVLKTPRYQNSERQRAKRSPASCALNDSMWRALCACLPACLPARLLFCLIKSFLKVLS